MPYRIVDDDKPVTYTVIDDEPPKKELPFGMQTMANIGGGMLRGAGSIGATLLTPYDLLAGNTKSIGNPERRAAMDEGLKSFGVDTGSLAYGGGKLASEIAGTAGVGGVLAKGASMVPGIAPGVVKAIETAGMTTGKELPLVREMAQRMFGGAITGGASAFAVNPEDTGMGAGIGAVAPPAFKAAGVVGGKIGSVLSGPAQSDDLVKAIETARSAGYVIPPSQANPTLGNRLLEGFSGKITTAQNASARNQAVTNKLASEAIGLPADTKLAPDVLGAVREKAGRAYAEIGNTGVIAPGEAYEAALDKIAAPFKLTAEAFPGAKPSPVLELVDSLRSPAFSAASAVEKIKQLRTAADDAFRAGNTDVGRAAKSASKALEDAVEVHLERIGEPQLLDAFKDARKLIAKTYTVEKALNPTTGSVDARKLATQLAKGKPLEGELRTAAEFADRFKTAAQPLERMGSLPQTSPLDWAFGGSLAASTSHPMALASVLARPVARKLTLSDLVQNRLVQQPPGMSLGGLLTSPDAQQLSYRVAPLLGVGQ